jgi:CyaY protein
MDARQAKMLSFHLSRYTKASMIDEATFRHESDKALDALEQALIRAEEEGGFEAEKKNGVLNVLFEDGAAKFVFTPNTPVRQVWISALSTSFKLEWNDTAHAFALPKTGEDLLTLTERLLREQLDDPSISLKS